MKRHYNIPIFIPHLGCPFNCIFCDQNKIASPEGIPRAERVTQIIEEYLHTIPADESEIEVAFFGGNFTAIDKDRQQEYLTAVSPFLENDKVQSIRISTRPDFIDQKILEFLLKNGVKTIELGVQSLSDEVLKASCRGYRVEDVFKACHLIKANQFRLGIQLMVGLPADTHEQDIESTQLTITLKPDMVRIYPTLVIEGTYLAEMFRTGKYMPLSLQEAVSITKDMFMLLQKNDIKVIRMGLQPSEDLRSEGTVVAGPFHPAFGELVEQEIFKEQARAVLQRFLSGQEGISIFVNPKDLSKMIGQKRANLKYLQDISGLESIQIKTSKIVDINGVGVGDLISEYPEQILLREEYLENY